MCIMQDDIFIDEDTIVMGSEPIPGMTPDEMREWFAHHNDRQGLADSFALTSNKYVWVEDNYYDYEEGTPEYSRTIEISDAWLALLDELEEQIYDILRIEGITIPKTRRIVVLRIYMERYGYYDGQGWWCKKRD